MNAIIVGAGIGGLSAALALRRVGVDTVIVEAAPVASPGLGGAFMNIAPNGINALAALGLAEQSPTLGTTAPGSSSATVTAEPSAGSTPPRSSDGSGPATS